MTQTASPQKQTPLLGVRSTQPGYVAPPRVLPPKPAQKQPVPTSSGAMQVKHTITLKLSALPPHQNTKNGWYAFHLRSGPLRFSITVKPKVWLKMANANTEFKMWGATLTGEVTKQTSEGFVLDGVGVQVFEKKPKEKKEPK